jgi:hypothetical protein
MAVRLATSDPKPSTRTPDYDFFYFNKQTPAGTECVALLHRSLRGLVRKGFAFDDSALRFDADLKGSVLELDFDQSPLHDPALPPHPEAGWGDPDHLAALHPAEPEPHPVALAAATPSTHVPLIPRAGLRPAAARRHAADSEETKIPVELLLSLEISARAYNYMATRIGVTSKPTCQEVRSLVITNLIPWLKEKLNLSAEESEDLMRAVR